MHLVKLPSCPGGTRQKLLWQRDLAQVCPSHPTSSREQPPRLPNGACLPWLIQQQLSKVTAVLGGVGFKRCP